MLLGRGFLISPCGSSGGGPSPAVGDLREPRPRHRLVPVPADSPAAVSRTCVRPASPFSWLPLSPPTPWPDSSPRPLSSRLAAHLVRPPSIAILAESSMPSSLLPPAGFRPFTTSSSHGPVKLPSRPGRPPACSANAPAGGFRRRASVLRQRPRTRPVHPHRAVEPVPCALAVS